MRRFGQVNMQVVLLVFLMILLAACGGESEDTTSSDSSSNDSNNNDEEVELRMGMLASEGEESPSFVAARDFANEVHEATDGRVKIELYPGAQLGGEVEMSEQINVGSLDMGLITSTTVANYVPELNVIEIPFLIEDRDHAFKVLDGEVGEMLYDKLDEGGYINLGFFDVGFKGISNSEKPIQNVDDLKGLDIRTGQSDILIETYKALGANPTPIAYPEVYSSIQQGVIDGFEGSYQSFTDINLYEIQDYYSEVQVGYFTSLMLMNKGIFNNLDAEIQDTLKDLAKKHIEKQREFSTETDGKLKELMLDEGVEILDSDQVDRDSFKNAVQDVYEQNEDVLGDLILKIQDAE